MGDLVPPPFGSDVSEQVIQFPQSRYQFTWVGTKTCNGPVHCLMVTSTFDN